MRKSIQIKRNRATNKSTIRALGEDITVTRNNVDNSKIDARGTGIDIDDNDAVGQSVIEASSTSDGSIQRDELVIIDAEIESSSQHALPQGEVQAIDLEQLPEKETLDRD
ncbi:hypothetical protein [Leptolyngbya sp. GGD]|uniref:hypothetical protein n=1 Tax=Leptolyngbya sp. GGD TaxID=2997907 RepID=UPI00227D4BE1|nr:hypothetical protein [Leptolyngbya sp. GGD]MCY6490283.1 hypothetical protein [Leptolyngbya sp. GGD]